MATREDQMIEEIKKLRTRIDELEKRGVDDSRVKALEAELEAVKKELKEKKGEPKEDEDEVIFDPW